MIAPGSRGTIVVHGNTDRDEAIRIDGGRSVAIVRPWGSTWTWRQSQIQAPTLDVVGENTRVYLQNITLVQNNFDVGVRVVGATVVLDETRVIKHEGGGVLVQDQGQLLARNAFIGQDHNAVDAVRINGGAATIVSSTLAGGGFNAAALSCNVFDAVQVRNAILVTRGGTASDEVVCSGADITFTATEGQRQGEGNVAVGEFPSASPTQWFADVANGDYHLTGAGLTAFAGVAHWTPDDPRWDIDGEDRPTLPRTPDFAGADVP
jgi:hypothetical protein